MIRAGIMNCSITASNYSSGAHSDKLQYALFTGMQLLGVAYNCMSQLYSERAVVSMYARV
jgi:hypothetical protein